MLSLLPVASACIPGERAHARIVTAQGTHLLEPAHVPDLNLGVVGADGDVLAVAAPLHAGDVIVTVVGIRLAQLLDVAAVGVPQVHHAAQRHRDLVGGSPVDEVQVVVVDELGRVEDPLGRAGTCLNVFLDLTPAPALFVYTPRAQSSPNRRGLGRLGLEREDLRRARAAVLQKVARQLLLVLLLRRRESCECGRASVSRSIGRRAIEGERFDSPGQIRREIGRRRGKSAYLEGEATSAARSRSLALAFSFTRL